MSAGTRMEPGTEPAREPPGVWEEPPFAAVEELCQAMLVILTEPATVLFPSYRARAVAALEEVQRFMR